MRSPPFMRIAEVFRSLQGEGLLTGTESFFIRASGCNLRCAFCDTPYASWQPEGEDLSVEQLSQLARESACGHVVLTGGEPMLFSELLPLCEQLRAQQQHITIETAGTLYLPVACDLMSISPKLSNSAPSQRLYPKWHQRHEQTRQSLAIVQRLIDEYEYQLKFVVQTPEDAQEVEQYLSGLRGVERERVLLMPQGTDIDELENVAQWLRPYCQQTGLHYCPRKQIEWFGLVRGT